MTRRQLMIGNVALLAGSPPLRRAAGDPGFFSETLDVLVDGYFRHTQATSGSLCVCDYPNGTKRPDGLARSGKSYASVSRMLPALAAIVASGRDSEDRAFRAILAVYRNAFNPAHPDYWLAATPDKPDLRQVESSLIAWVLWLLRDRLLNALSKEERANVQSWLESCTQRVVRYNNFAWFTAVNHAVRIALSKDWHEFEGDEQFMLDDLKALDEMYAGDGWYGDGKDQRIYDYYSFWVFSSHYLYWREIIGSRYPEWSLRFETRVRRLLEQAPLLFAANGSHALMGVSAVYRWAILTPLVLAYRHGLWPHSPGLLRSVVRRNISFFWRHGAFDSTAGRLNEVISDRGTPEFAESYIDGGHPYWCMQAYAFLLIPANDRFWTEPEEPLPCTKGSYVKPVAGPSLLIAGVQSTGDVRVYFANNGRHDPWHRDRYSKFSYSARFPLCFVRTRDRATWDNALVFRDPATGRIAGRSGITSGRLVDGGIETDWWAQIDDARIRVISRVAPNGETESRQHTVHCPEQLLNRGIEIWEGSAALPLAATEVHGSERRGKRVTISAAAGSTGVVDYDGHRQVDIESEFLETLGIARINAIAPQCAIVTLKTRLRHATTNLQATFLIRPTMPKEGYK